MPPEYYGKDRGKGAIRLMTEEAKKKFDVPIILIGYMTPELGEQMLEEGKADFIGMNRPLIADADLPNKLKAGHPELVAPCTRCGTCLDQNESFLRHCRINAQVGFGMYGVPNADKQEESGGRGRRPGRHGSRPGVRDARS